jgi:hypothetical protein
MEYGYITETPIYNKISGLYDVKLMVDKDIITISCYRLLNGTKLKYTNSPGYFLISLDDKYLFINDKTDINTFIKNIIFSKNNLNYTNEDILEINTDPITQYTKLTPIDIPPEYCINLALEENETDRNFQIVNKDLYNKYDCMVKNITSMTNNSFTNLEPKKTGIFESMSYYFTGSPSGTQQTQEGNCNVQVTSILEDVQQNNTFYVYGLTSLNFLFFIIMILMVYQIVLDTEKINKFPKKSEFEI